MTHAEAKFILGVYRPNGEDAGNPAFREAIEQARSDPQLAAWFSRSQAHDAAIAASLREVEPPAGLREGILAGARLGGAPRAWWRQPAWTALAAGFAALVTAGVIFNEYRLEAPMRSFAQFAAADTVAGDHHGEGPARDALGSWLATSNARLGSASIPVDFDRLRATGCRTVHFAGHDVLEVCFGRGPGMFHLYVLRRSDAPDIPARESPVFLVETHAEAVAWSDTRYCYALATDLGVAALKQVL